MEEPISVICGLHHDTELHILDLRADQQEIGTGLIELPLPSPHTRRDHHHLVGRGLSGIGVTLCVRVVVDVLSVVIDVIPVREGRYIGVL